MPKKDKKPIISVTIKDCEQQFYRAGGHGGQNVNKVSTAVRLIHHPSGARAQAQDERFREQNRKIAFLRLVNTKEFQSWIRLESMRKLGIEADIEQRVDNMMNPKNIVVEGKDEKGRWTKI